MVGRWAALATRAVPFAGRTDAPSGHALRGKPAMRGPQCTSRPNNMRAEGPGVLPAKGNALVIGSPPGIIHASILDHPSAQRANNSYASIARTDLGCTLPSAPRDAVPSLQDEDIREEMFRMLGHHAKELGWPPARLGGWIDHVHILCGLCEL